VPRFLPSSFPTGRQHNNHLHLSYRTASAPTRFLSPRPRRGRRDGTCGLRCDDAGTHLRPELSGLRRDKQDAAAGHEWQTGQAQTCVFLRFFAQIWSFFADFDTSCFALVVRAGKPPFSAGIFPRRGHADCRLCFHRFTAETPASADSLASRRSRGPPGEADGRRTQRKTETGERRRQKTVARGLGPANVVRPKA